ncbi:hypothetical protein NCC49_004822 [Naganishia albida]|nr:hypothetical protein NCC49_004822 [Naganishia albida]
MPQIEFYPPLATTTTLHLPPLPVLSGDPHVLLTFYAKPIDALYEGDRIEIWTDGGSPGQWRSAPFVPTQHGKHVATISVRVEDGSFGYTYRVVHTTGEETWLGDMGANGKIDLVMTQGDEMWKGEDWLKFDKEGWSGFGVHVDESNVPSGVLTSDPSSPNVAFAYLHPSSSAPFATYHPTSTAPASSTAFALLSAPGAVLSSSLVPVAENTSSISTSPPAAYASYCGLGFSTGEAERTKAFRSLLGLSRGLFEYVPCKEKKGNVHAAGLVCRGGERQKFVAYVDAGEAEWDLSGLNAGKEGIALWNDKSKRAQLVPGSSTPAYQLAAETSNPVVEILDIVHLFQLSHEGATVRFGFLNTAEALDWTLEPERTIVEQITVDEIVETPVRETKALADTSDSGETAGSSMGFTEGGFSDVGDETEVTSLEEVEDGATVGKGPVEEGVVVEEEREVPSAAEVQEAEAGAGDTVSVVEEPSAAENTTNDPAPAGSAPKSILRFVWITLGFLNSLWWRTVSWFRRWTSTRAVEGLPSGDGAPQVNDEASEETPLAAESAHRKDYASTSQQTLVPDVAKPTEPAAPSAPSKKTADAPTEEYETIRVPETLTTVFPEHLSATGVKNDVFLLSSLRDLGCVVAEFKLGEKDAAWQSLTLVEQTVASGSDMLLVKLLMKGDGQAQVRIRLA